MSKIILKIEDFSEFPGGRYRTDGDFSGEQYREDIINPIINEYDKIEIDFQNAFVLIPSFLDESIGHYVEQLGLEKFEEKFSFRYKEDSNFKIFLDEVIDGRVHTQKRGIFSFLKKRSNDE